MPSNFGWKKDTRKPDEITNYHRRRLAVVAEKSDLSAYIPKIGNQDGVGACTGFGFGENIASYAAKKGMIQPHIDIFDSVNWLYNGGRKKRGWLNEDTGAYPDDVADWFVEQGALLWTDWPFENKLDTTDPIQYASKAILFANRTKFRVDNSVDGIRSALSEGYVVSIGTPWPKSWMSYNSGVLRNVTSTEAMAGGHETLLWGHDDSQHVFFGSNSWGTGWGVNIPALGTRGGFVMPMSAMESFKKYHGGYDAHYLTFDAVALVYALNLAASPVGKGAVTGSGIYNANAEVTIKARPVSKYKFSMWSPEKNIANPKMAETVAKMSCDLNVTAYFVKKSPICAGFDNLKKIVKR
jgi:hypothetical protein